MASFGSFYEKLFAKGFLRENKIIEGLISVVETL
jgi:hypothetical protein